MKILVGVKYGLKVEELVLDTRTGKVYEEDTPKQMDTFSKKALEEALRIKEKMGGTVTVVTIGKEEAKKILIEAYAMGADEAYLIKTENTDAPLTAAILAKFYEKTGPYDIVLLGGATTDSYTATVPSLLSAELGIPLLPMANKVEIADGSIKVESALKDALYVYESPLPAVVSVSLDINEPRIPKLPQILKAKRKPIKIMSLDDLGVEQKISLNVVGVGAFMVERKKIIFDASSPDKVGDAVQKLIEKLREEGLI